jgi:Short C-terminal domain
MGLLKTGLKAAVAVKTADIIHERIQKRQEEQWARLGQQGPAEELPAPAGAADTVSTLAQLTQLGELKASGVLTDSEFEAQKSRILGTQ